MSRDSVEVVRKAIDASNRGDVEASLADTHPDAEWVVAKEHPNAGTHRGHAAIIAYRAEWQEMLDPIRFDVDQLIDAGDKVVSVGRVRGRGIGSGIDVDVPLALVSELRDGQVVRTEEYLDPREALKAAGVPE